MENASKALIIAGAILIAILLISVGLVVFNSTKGVTDQAGELGRTMTAEVFNSQFTQYFGDRVRGSTVRELINRINSYNASHTDLNDNINVTYSPADLSIQNNETYKVSSSSEGGYNESGYIRNITISSSAN